MDFIVSIYPVTIKEKDSEERIPFTAIKTSSEVVEGLGITFYAKESIEEIKSVMQKL